MPKFLVRKAAYTRCEYTEVIEAETPAEAAAILDDKEIDGGEFMDDSDYWEEHPAEVVQTMYDMIVHGRDRLGNSVVMDVTVTGIRHAHSTFLAAYPGGTIRLVEGEE